MNDRPIDESDVVDVLLNQASQEVRDKVRTAVQSDPKIAALHERWACDLPALKVEREHAKAVTGRVREHVKARLTRESRTEQASAPRSRSRFRVVAGFAAMACAVAVLVFVAGPGQYFVDLGKESNSKEIMSIDVLAPEMDLSPAHIGEVSYSYKVGDNSDVSADIDRTYIDLAKAIEAVPAGGVLVVHASEASASIPETPRLTKPMRIEAGGGPVRFGLDPDHG
jgi:hypothetical protein